MSDRPAECNCHARSAGQMFAERPGDHHADSCPARSSPDRPADLAQQARERAASLQERLGVGIYASEDGTHAIVDFDSLDALASVVEPLREALTWISDPSYVGNYDSEVVVEIHRQWAKAALRTLVEETRGGST